MVRILFLLSSRNCGFLFGSEKLDVIRVLIRTMLALITCLSLLFDLSENGSTFNSQFLVPPPICPLWPIKLVGLKPRTFCIKKSLVIVERDCHKLS